MDIVGKGIPKIDGMGITTAKPVYTDDLVPKDALIIKLLRSPHANAIIKNIDISKVTKLENIECILTYKDVGETKFTLAGQSYPEASPYDRLILDKNIRYVGQEVAIVAGSDESSINKALKLIKVEYEVFTPVLDMEKAIDNEVIVHKEHIHNNVDFGMQRERNIVVDYDKSFGDDIQKTLQECDVVVEDTYYTQAQAHAMMETYRAFSYIDHNNRLVVTTSTQIPFHVRRQLSKALEIPLQDVRVIKPRIGGGFGGKQNGCVEMFTALVTLKTRKPSKIIYDRKETFSCTSSRHQMKLNVKIGSDKNGKIKAIDIKGLSDAGAHGEHGSTTFNLAGEKTLPIYSRINAARFKGQVVYTNKMPGGALRGFGATQGTFAVESTINKLANKLNMDPTDLRFLNIVKEGDVSVAYNKPLRSSTLDKCIEKGKKLIKWDEKYPFKKVSDNVIRSVGMAVAMQGSGVAKLDCASVEIKLNDSGHYTLYTGSADMGTGSDTILAQIACEELKTTMDNIVVHSGDTDISPYDTGSYASSTTYVTGMAAIKSAKDLKEKIIKCGAKYLDLSYENVEFDGKHIKDTNDENNKISIKDIANKSVVGYQSERLVGFGSYGSEDSPPPFVAGFVEVEIDTETGKVKVINFVSVIDCGTVINKNLATIQAEGGIVQGIGMALYEDVIYDDKGKMITNTFMQYKIPSRCDIGNIIVDFEESYEPTGPFGAKSIGEVVINTPCPAISNAIYNGIGVRVNSLPITPEKIFMAYKNK
ncbi:xanthine dehydrogenase family protein molybdopterin-binding subunit [Romboutsia sp.]|uniref:xanthine dehydrogenase family protein molybdopterin-binding subunit n=1 Tax=Romboutsia sp. TaxID=1965302 RepID=UPI002BDDDE89|nr:molybdopterin cofactor-binding domain-containing protein [Romboutsia sp.]HSQ90449.1 molybdopterin cofactor-binding domain-containing protein [Romboutsia sp.]